MEHSVAKPMQIDLLFPPHYNWLRYRLHCPQNSHSSTPKIKQSLNDLPMDDNNNSNNNNNNPY